MESYKIVKFGIFDDFSHTFDKETITNIQALNVKELIVSTTEHFFIIDKTTVKKKFPLKFSTFTIAQGSDYLIGVTIKESNLNIYKLSDFLHGKQSNNAKSPPQYIESIATNQSNITHIYYSPKSHLIITIGNGIKVFNLKIKKDDDLSDKPPISIIKYSTFSINYLAPIMTPPVFDNETELLLLPTETGIHAFTLTSAKIGRCTKYPSSSKTVFATYPTKASKLSKHTPITSSTVMMKRELPSFTKQLLTFDSNEGMNLWDSKGQLINHYDTIRSTVLSIIFIDSENAICINSCNILFFLNIRTGKTFYYMNLEKTPTRLFLTYIKKEPVLCACFGSYLRALKLVIPWRVWNLNLEKTLSMKRCNKFLSAARILIDAENSFIKLYSPRTGKQLCVAKTNEAFRPVSYLYDRGIYENYVFNSGTFSYEPKVIQIDDQKENGSNDRDSLFIVLQSGQILSFDPRIQTDCEEALNINFKASFITICRFKCQNKKDDFQWGFAVASEKGDIIVFDYSSLNELYHFTLDEDGLIQMFFDFEYNCIVLVFAQKTTLFDIEKGKIIDSININGNRITAFFSNFLMYGYDTGHIQRIGIEYKRFIVYNNENKKVGRDKGEMIMSKPHSCPITGFSFAQKIWISAGLDGNVVIWNYKFNIIFKIYLPLPLRSCVILNGKCDILVATATEIMQIKDKLLYSYLKKEEKIDPENDEIDNLDLMVDDLYQQQGINSDSEYESDLDDDNDYDVEDLDYEEKTNNINNNNGKLNRKVSDVNNESVPSLSMSTAPISKLLPGSSSSPTKQGQSSNDKSKTISNSAGTKNDDGNKLKKDGNQNENDTNKKQTPADKSSTKSTDKNNTKSTDKNNTKSTDKNNTKSSDKNNTNSADVEKINKDKNNTESKGNKSDKNSSSNTDAKTRPNSSKSTASDKDKDSSKNKYKASSSDKAKTNEKDGSKTSDKTKSNIKDANKDKAKVNSNDKDSSKSKDKTKSNTKSNSNDDDSEKASSKDKSKSKTNAASSDKSKDTANKKSGSKSKEGNNIKDDEEDETTNDNAKENKGSDKKVNKSNTKGNKESTDSTTKNQDPKSSKKNKLSDSNETDNSAENDKSDELKKNKASSSNSKTDEENDKSKSSSKSDKVSKSDSKIGKNESESKSTKTNDSNVDDKSTNEKDDSSSTSKSNSKSDKISKSNSKSDVDTKSDSKDNKISSSSSKTDTDKQKISSSSSKTDTDKQKTSNSSSITDTDKQKTSSSSSKTDDSNKVNNSKSESLLENNKRDQKDAESENNKATSSNEKDELNNDKNESERNETNQNNNSEIDRVNKDELNKQTNEGDDKSKEGHEIENENNQNNQDNEDKQNDKLDNKENESDQNSQDKDNNQTDQDDDKPKVESDDQKQNDSNDQSNLSNENKDDENEEDKAKQNDELNDSDQIDQSNKENKDENGLNQGNENQNENGENIDDQRDNYGDNNLGNQSDAMNENKQDFGETDKPNSGEDDGLNETTNNGNCNLDENSENGEGNNENHGDSLNHEEDQERLQNGDEAEEDQPQAMNENEDENANEEEAMSVGNENENQVTIEEPFTGQYVRVPPPNVVIDKDELFSLYANGRREFKPLVEEVEREEEIYNNWHNNLAYVQNMTSTIASYEEYQRQKQSKKGFTLLPKPSPRIQHAKSARANRIDDDSKNNNCFITANSKSISVDPSSPSTPRRQNQSQSASLSSPSSPSSHRSSLPHIKKMCYPASYVHNYSNNYDTNNAIATPRLFGRFSNVDNMIEGVENDNNQSFFSSPVSSPTKQTTQLPPLLYSQPINAEMQSPNVSSPVRSPPLGRTVPSPRRKLKQTH